jgi:hypothetical protein
VCPKDCLGHRTYAILVSQWEEGLGVSLIISGLALERCIQGKRDEMKRKNWFRLKLKRAGEVLRREGFLSFLLRSMQMARIQITPFYYMKEALPQNVPANLTTLPEGYDFSAFDFRDVMVISNLPERESYTDPEYAIDNFNQGNRCWGIKYNGEIVAFTWVSFDKTWTKLYKTSLRENEAYLFDMYVLKAFRGMNLAPLLRCRTYEVLRGMGRDTFYSISGFFNTAALRFKQKLDARIVFLGVYIRLFSERFQGQWVLKRYQ